MMAVTSLREDSPRPDSYRDRSPTLFAAGGKEGRGVFIYDFSSLFMRSIERVVQRSADRVSLRRAT